ncbi:Uncharacterised protein [Porphyromonas macacae]|uniref:Uncharacterized protein n=2 Tax=Porphyromonas macacae TaxID=28115 RepID=A0A379E673_9PORP|nr:hypothetical protein [Porphyromonas macacae]SUB88156.1 Uncharacterised protein [Porphyromonas macacae]
MMRRNGLLIVVLLFFLMIFGSNLNAQRVEPIEKRLEYFRKGGIPDENIQFKDLNHHLDKFLGVWKGSCNAGRCKGFLYEIHIEKGIKKGVAVDYTEETLYLRYRVVDENGNELFNSLEIKDKTNRGVIKGAYLGNIKGTGYVFNYFGESYKNTQMSYIGCHFSEDGKQLLLDLHPRDVWLQDGGRQLFPTRFEETYVYLTKQ